MGIHESGRQSQADAAQPLHGLGSTLRSQPFDHLCGCAQVLDPIPFYQDRPVGDHPVVPVTGDGEIQVFDEDPKERDRGHSLLCVFLNTLTGHS